MDFSFQVVNNYEDLPQSALDLFYDCRNGSPFLSADWYRLFAEYVAPTLGKMQWLLLQRDCRTLAILPMLLKEHRVKRTLSSLTNYYSPYFDLIVVDQQRDKYMRQLLISGREYFKQFDAIDIVPVTNQVALSFMDLFREQSFYAYAYQHSDNWRELEISSFASYWAERPSKLRSTVKRKSKKLNREGGFRYVLHTDDDPAVALQHYASVYERSWKVPEPFPDFIEGLVRNASKAGELRFALLYHFERPVAAQIWFVSGSLAAIFKLAYDPEYRSYSVGTLLSAYLAEWVLDKDGVRDIDFLTGNDSYKSDWMSSHRMLYGVQVLNKGSVAGFLMLARIKVISIMRRLWAVLHQGVKVGRTI